MDSSNMVYHVQIREDMEPHVAHFRWISPETFVNSLIPYFWVERISRNRTDYYKCTRKDEH